MVGRHKIGMPMVFVNAVVATFNQEMAIARTVVILLVQTLQRFV